MHGIQRILRAALVVEQLVLRLLFRLFAAIPALRHVKTDAAAEQGGQRPHLHPHALRRHVERHAAVFPEAHVGGDQLIVRRGNEQLIAHGARFRIEIAGFHRADAVAAEQHRIAGVELARFFAVQHDAQPFGIRRGQRRRVEQLIVVFAVFALVARLQFDIGAGEQRAQPGDAFTADLRLHHPEGGVLAQQFLHAGIKARLNHHLAQILAQRDGFHHADVHAAAFDFGFTRFQPFRRRGDQRHYRPLMAEVVKQDPGADQRGHDGNDPHRRPALDLLDVRDAMIIFRHLAAPC
ncbi:Uncharacterised protein [Serratia marcescens]|nr:Uncharacterised protein [Serratia marcescens]